MRAKVLYNVKYLPNIPIVMTVSRESHYFDLGLQVGDVGLYCQSLLDFVIEAIANDMWAMVHDGRPAAWTLLNDYDEMVARFAFVVGSNLDVERISEDLQFIYHNLRPVIDIHYPNWSYNCPGRFKVRITPGSFVFLVDL